MTGVPDEPECSCGEFPHDLECDRAMWRMFRGPQLFGREAKGRFPHRPEPRGVHQAVAAVCRVAVRVCARYSRVAGYEYIVRVAADGINVVILRLLGIPGLACAGLAVAYVVLLGVDLPARPGWRVHERIGVEGLTIVACIAAVYAGWFAVGRLG